MASTSGNLGRGLTDLLGRPVASESKTFFASSAHCFTPIFVDRVDAPSPPPIPSAQLIESIRRHGLFCPVVVSKTGDRFTLIAGGDRLGAAREAGLREVPACVVELEGVAPAALAHAEADQHPTPNMKALHREWRNSLALDMGCDVDELSHKLGTLREPAKPNQLRTIIGSATSTAAVLILLGWAMGPCSSTKISPTTIAAEKTWTPDDSGIRVLTNTNGLGARSTVYEAFETGIDPKLPIGMDEPESARESPTRIPPEMMPSTLMGAEAPPSSLSWLESTHIDGIQIVKEENGVRFIFDAPVFQYRDFIAPGAKDALRKSGKLLADAAEETLLVITGHTDNEPVSSGGVYIDNYQIGMARAVAVTDFLVRDEGLPRERVVATSAGENQPPFSNDSPSEKQKNRTVTLLFLDQGSR